MSPRKPKSKLLDPTARSVLVTGASGYIGRLLIERLAAEPGSIENLVAFDVADVPKKKRLEGVHYVKGDIRKPLDGLFKAHKTDTVVHLASIVKAPPGKEGRQFAYEVDVEGTQNILKACLKAKAKKLIVTSSGAAYGYYADNPEWLVESDAIRGNESFAYSYHKRLVEEMLAKARDEHPQLKQLILRPGTILGANVSNQITDLFEKPVVLGVTGRDTPFVFIWDEDVVSVIETGIRKDKVGVYNLAGDGYLTMRDIAKKIGKPYVAIPGLALEAALAVLKILGKTQYGPEQVDFIRYRPVLSNERLKTVFRYKPKKTSEEVFDFYWGQRGLG